MKRILFDTTVVARWYQDHPKFRLPIQRLFSDLSRHGTIIERFISVVTLQEMMYWAITQGDPDGLSRFLAESFSAPLIFDPIIAMGAAELQRLVARPPRQRPASADDLAVDVWFRDAAIVATAKRHRMDAIVTCDKGLHNKFKPHFDGVLYLVEEQPMNSP